MSQPSAQDFLQAFDPTAYTSISGAQLLQYITGEAPFTDKGLVVVSTDTAGVPNTPDASVTTKWQRYIWVRIGATSISVYVWNPYTPNVDVNLKNWQGINTAGIAAGSIQGYQIANNTIVDGNISDVNWSKIIGAPTALPPSGAAGPTILSGTYPDPGIANGAITSAMIADNAIKGGASEQLATGANGVDLSQNVKVPANSNLGSPSGGSVAVAANDRVVLGVGATNFVTVQKVIDALAEPAAGNALMDVQVNTAGTGFQYSAHRVLQKVLTTDNTVNATSGNITVGTSALQYGATGNTVYTALQTSITPLSAASTIIVKLNIQIGNAAIKYHVASLYNSTTAGGAALACAGFNGYSGTISFVYKYAPGATTAITFYVKYGVDGGTSYTNTLNSNVADTFGGTMSSIEITEYL